MPFGTYQIPMPLTLFMHAGLTLLLSLRFLSQVFEEGRNLCLGLAARGIDWGSLGPAGGVQVLLQLFKQLFLNLFQRSSSISEAMCARGFVGAQDHNFYLTNTQSTSRVLNFVALVLLILMGVVSLR